jgi:hypothetical protein
MGELYALLKSPKAVLFTKLNLCCVFDIEEQIEHVLEGQILGELDLEMVHISLQLATGYGRHPILERFLTRY